jgi:hypothetical protein
VEARARGRIEHLRAKYAHGHLSTLSTALH